MSIRPNRRRGIPLAVPIIAITTIGIGAAIGTSIARVNALDTYQGCTVTEREDRALASLDKRDPRVYTDCGVFTVADEPFRLHFTSADVYNALKPGATVDITTVGWRVGALSWFPNVLEVGVSG